MNYPDYLKNDMTYPMFYKINMAFKRKGIPDISEALLPSLKNEIIGAGIKQGERVAVCVGSRGITDIREIVRLICEQIQEVGARPFIIPSMGSHGGANAEGQISVLEGLGIMEDICGTRILSSMNVLSLGTVLDDIPVWLSEDIQEMEHVICVNRVKPHTKFTGSLGSGLYKMLAVGMGKHAGAEACHQAALRHGFLPVIKAIGDRVLEKSYFRFGVAVVEDLFDETMMVEAISASSMYKREGELLAIAKKHVPRLPVSQLDSLIVRTIGKDISGSGMDPNVTGRAWDTNEDDFSENLSVTRIAVLDLTEKTEGNGIGLGTADFITETLFEKLDYTKTIINALTSLSFRKASIPLRLPSEELAIKAAMMTTGKANIADLRLAVIQNTQDLSEFYVSEAVLPELRQIPEASVGESTVLTFDENGKLVL